MSVSCLCIMVIKKSACRLVEGEWCKAVPADGKHLPPLPPSSPDKLQGGGRGGVEEKSEISSHRTLLKEGKLQQVLLQREGCSFVGAWPPISKRHYPVRGAVLSLHTVRSGGSQAGSAPGPVGSAESEV